MENMSLEKTNQSCSQAESLELHQGFEETEMDQSLDDYLYHVFQFGGPQ